MSVTEQDHKTFGTILDRVLDAQGVSPVNPKQLDEKIKQTRNSEYEKLREIIRQMQTNYYITNDGTWYTYR